MSAPFAPGFIWGVSTAGHQIEGDNVDSDTWFLENVSPTVFMEPSARACNSWELWETDLDLVVSMGLNAYRFSVEWARIEPVEGEFSETALDHYDAVIEGCLARGLSPIVTFSHFTSPHWFAKRGAWLDPASADLFARFVRKVMERVGDRIAYAVTFNEPNLPTMLTWAGLPEFVPALERATLEAASRAAGVERYRAGNVMVPEDFAGMQVGMAAAHRAAVDVVKGLRPDLPIGLSLAMVDDVAVEGGEATRDRKRAEVYDYWLTLARDDDFIGVQNYERHYYGPDGAVAAPGTTDAPGLYSGSEPASLAGAVIYAHEVSGRPVLVTEHGMSTEDDTARVAFLGPSLDHLADAIAAGVPVLGYCHWTLIDNFEWIFGYGPKLGLHSLDRETFTRTPKPSARAYADLVARFTA